MRESLLSGNSFFNTFHCLLPNSAFIDVGDSIMVPDIIIFFQDLKALFKPIFNYQSIRYLITLPIFFVHCSLFLFLFLILFIIPQYYFLLDGMKTSLYIILILYFIYSLFLKQHFLFLLFS